MIPVVKESFNLKSKSDMIRCHILMKCYELGDIPEKSELDVLEYLYIIGGIDGKESNTEFIKYCVTKEFRGSDQSVRNVLSKYTDLGFLVKPKNCIRQFKHTLLPYIAEDVFVLDYFITNLDINASNSKSNS